MPKQINTYTFGRSLVQKFGLKGRFQPVLDEVIVPVTIVDSVATSKLCVGGAITAASGAGNQNRVKFVNPTGSGVVATLQRFWAVSGAPTSDFFHILKGTASGAISGFRVFRDSQYSGLTRCGFQTAALGAAVLTGPQYHMDTDSNVYEETWIVRPGFTLEFRQNAQNQTFDVWVDWTETDLVTGDTT